MKVFIIALAASLMNISSLAQGTIIFYNRDFSSPNADGMSSAPIAGITDVATARAQLYLVSAGNYTPLTPLQTFRPPPNQEFFFAPVSVAVPNRPAGTTGVQFVVRVWQQADSYETATQRGESPLITISAPLGGTNTQGVVFASPDLGGPNGLQGTPWTFPPPPPPPAPRLVFTAFSIEGNNLRFNIFSELISSGNYIVDASSDLQTWTPVLTNPVSVTSFTLPYNSSTLSQQFRLRSPFTPDTSGTIIFFNRSLSERTPGGGTYNVPVPGVTDVATARAQLYLLTGSGPTATYVPLQPLQTFRNPPNEQFFIAPVTVSVVGQPPGTTGLQFVVRAWQGADTWESATMRAESNLITVAAPLGGTNSQGISFPSPDLGGPNGWQGFPF